jgi:hypothetical protein
MQRLDAGPSSRVASITVLVLAWALLGFVRIWLSLTILCDRVRTQIRRSFESVRGTGSRAI